MHGVAVYLNQQWRLLLKYIALKVAVGELDCGRRNVLCGFLELLKVVLKWVAKIPSRCLHSSQSWCDIVNTACAMDQLQLMNLELAAVCTVLRRVDINSMYQVGGIWNQFLLRQKSIR